MRGITIQFLIKLIIKNGEFMIEYKRKSFEPDFANLEKVFQRKVPNRPTLFEFAMNARIINKLSSTPNSDDKHAGVKQLIEAFTNAGYDYTTLSAWRTNTLSFPKNDIDKLASHSLNSGSMITDWESFEKYPWPDPNIGDYDLYLETKTYLPDGMKLVASSNGGLLENAIDLVGFETLSMMTMLDEKFTKAVFDAIGARLLRFYEIVAPIETIGACIVNDDWGFKNQTMFHPDVMRQYIFPWQKKFVETIQKSGKYAILHSCGQVKAVMNDIIDDMLFDAKHSYEDQITPVEDAIELWATEYQFWEELIWIFWQEKLLMKLESAPKNCWRFRWKKVDTPSDLEIVSLNIYLMKIILL